MAEILTKYGGMTVRTVKPGDIVITPRRSRGGVGGRAPSPAPRQPTITIKNGKVFINGQGFSVRPSSQEEFIKQKGGAITESIKSQITSSILKEQQLAQQKLAQQQLAQQKLREQQSQQKLRQREIYDPKTKTYMTSPYGMGAGGTAYQRQPTREEQIKIDLAQRGGEPSTYLTGYSPKEYQELTQVETKIYSGIEKYNEDIKKFEDKYKDLIKENEFIGTEAEFKKYQTDFNKLDIQKTKIDSYSKRYESLGGSISDKGLEMPKVTIGGGFGLRGRKVPISKFAGLYSATGLGAVDVTRKIGGVLDFGITQTTYAYGETLGKVVGEETKFTIFKERKIPEKIENIFIPQFGTQQIDVSTGKPITDYKDITIPARTRPEVSFTGKEYGLAVGDVGALGGTLSKYALPGAGKIFWGAEVGASVKESGSVGQWIKEKPLEAGITGAFILGAGISKGVKGYKYLKKTPIKVKTATGYRITTRWDEFAGKRVRISTRAGAKVGDTIVRTEILPSERYLKEVTRKVVSPAKTTGIEVVRTKITDTGEKTFSKFLVVGEKPVVMETGIYSKAGKKFFGVKTDVSINIIRAQPTISKPFGGVPVQVDKPFILQTSRLGTTGKLGKSKFEIIYPDKSIRIGAEDLTKLGTRQKYLVTETISKGKLGYRPVKDPSKYISEEELLSFGAVRKVDVTKQIGRTGTRAETFSIIEPSTKVGEIKVYDVLTGYKTTTKPLARATGRIPTSDIKVFEFPIIDKTTPKTFGITPADITKTPLTTTFATTKLKSIKVIPDIKTPTITGQTIITPTPTSTITEIPLMVGGLGLQESKYTGTGMYERTESLGAISQVGISQPVTIKIEQMPKLGMGLREVSFVGEKERGLQIQKPLQVSALKETQLDIQKSFLDVKPLQKVSQTQRQAQIQKQVLRQAQQLKQAQIQRQVQVQKQAQTQISETPFKPKFAFGLGKAIKKVQKIAKEESGLFEAWGKRFGKEVKLGTFGTKEIAEKKLSKFLKGTLSAAGFITKDKKKIKASEIELLKEREFRKSKLSEFLIIERKEKRLRKAGTGKEIQFFRGLGSKKKKSKSLFGI